MKQLVPPSVYNGVLLSFPSLYHTNLFRYESNLTNTGITELLSSLDRAMHLDGNIIECGSSRCGSSILMVRHMQSSGISKLIYACDSFEGFEPAELENEIRNERIETQARRYFKSTSLQYVSRKLELLGLQEMIRPVPGYFKNSLPSIHSDYCFAFVDCDLGDSAIYCTRQIWPKMVSKGVMVFDDYRLPCMRWAIRDILNTYRDDIAELSEMARLLRITKC